VLDILEYGHFQKNPRSQVTPIIQAIECPGFNLFEMEYDTKQVIRIQEKIIISKDPSCKVGRVVKRLKYHGLTQTAKELLQNTLELHIQEKEQYYINFINKAGPITKRRHVLNLFPGVGEKLMWEIINAREQKPFESFEDFHTRIKSIKSLPTLISKRIINELIDDEERHVIFVKRRQSSSRSAGSKSYGKKSYGYKKSSQPRQPRSNRPPRRY